MGALLLLLTSLMACRPGGGGDAGLGASQAGTDSAADTASEEPGWGCVTNLTTGLVYSKLQTALDAAHSGDILELCDEKLAEGGSSPVDVALWGGQVQGTVTLPGGGVSGSWIEHLAIAEGAAFAQDATIERLDVVGTLSLERGEVADLRLAAGATVSVADAAVEQVSSQGTLTIARSDVGMLTSVGTTSVGTSSIGQLIVQEGLLTADDVDLWGTLRVAGGIARLSGVASVDPGEVGIQVDGGALYLEDSALTDTAVDLDRIGFFMTGGEAKLDGVAISGFSGSALTLEGGSLETNGLSVVGACHFLGGELDATGLDCDEVVLEQGSARIEQLVATSLSATGSALEIEGGSLGGGTGTAMNLQDSETVLTDVDLDGIVATVETFPLDGGGWTEFELGGTGLAVSGGSLEVEGLTVHDVACGMNVSAGAVLTGGDVEMSWTWQAGLVATDATVVLSGIAVSDGRGWGVVGIRSRLDLEGAYVVDLEKERRVVQVFDESGTLIDEVISSPADPGIASFQGDLRLDAPTLENLESAAIFVDSSKDGSVAWIGDAAIEDVGGHGIYAASTGEGGTIDIRQVQIAWAGGGGVIVYGGASTTVDLYAVSVRISENQAVMVSGPGRATLSEIKVDGSESHGVDLDSIADLAVEHIDVTGAAKDGVRLEGVVGDLQQVSAAHSGAAGVRITQSKVGLSEGSVSVGRLGLSCDTESVINPCEEFTFAEVDIINEGCPAACVE